MSVSLEETIAKLDEVRKRGILGICGIKISYILKLLRELQERRKQSEIIHCKDCRWNDGVCYCEFHYRDVKPTDYCSWSERRTDD